MTETNLIYFFTLISLLIHASLFFITKEISYFSGKNSTDNEKMVLSAKKISLFDWPSKMHSIPFNRSQLREYYTICLKIIGFFFKNKDGDYLNVFLSLLSNFLSSVLVLLISLEIFDLKISLIISSFYLFCFWSFYISIYAGHSLVSQMFFLLSIYLTILSISELNYFFSFLSGLFIAISFFSSSASRKYPIIFIMLISWIFFRSKLEINITDFIIIFLLLIIFLFLLLKYYKKIIKNNLLPRYLFISLNVILFSYLLDKSFTYLIYYFFLILGIFVIKIHIFFPIKNLSKNISRYIFWLNVSKWGNHFKTYNNQKDYFGKNLGLNFRGEGIFWYHKLLLLFCPFVYFLYLFSLIILIVQLLQSYFIFKTIEYENLVIIFFSFAPIFIHEFTKGLRVGKTIFVTVIFFIFIIAYSLNVLRIDFNNYYNSFLPFIYILIILNLIHSIYVLFYFIIPERNYIQVLHNYLKKNKIKFFYTYNIEYNKIFVDLLMYTYPDYYKYDFINSTDQIKEGYILIPPLNNKSVNFESDKEIHNNQLLKNINKKKLLRNHSNMKIVDILKLKTLSSSKYFVHESEVTSFLRFNVNKISEEDFENGYAWVLKK